MNDSSRISTTYALQAASEEDLARRVQDGCLDSFTELAKRVQPRLMFVLRRRMGNHADAEDIAQRTLLRAFDKIQLYNVERKFSPWLFTIALRLATDHHRKLQLPTISADESIATAVDPRPTPTQQLLDRENSNDLWTLAEQFLKPDQWTALWLLYGEGQTVREIAHSLNRTTVSVRVLLHRARKRLTPHLEKFTEAESSKTDDNKTTDYALSPTLHVARAES